MASLACNLSAIVVTCEGTSQSDTAHIDIDRFGSRSRHDSSSEPGISDTHQVEGPFLSCSPVAPFQLNQFLSSEDNTFNGATSQALRQQSLYSNPESFFSGFGADESQSSIRDHVTSPFHPPSNQFSDLGFTSPRSSQEPPSDRLIQVILRDTASSIPQSCDGIENLLRPRRCSDGLMGDFPTSYHGLQFDQLHSPFNFGSNNGHGLTFGNGYPGGTPAPEMFFVGQDQTSSHPHAPLSPIAHFSLDPYFPLDAHTRPSPFAPADNTKDRAHFSWLSSFGPSTQGMDANDGPPGGSHYAPESYAEGVARFPSRPSCDFPPPGADVDRGLSGGPFFAPASSSENGVPSHCSCGLPPRGVDVSHGLLGGPYFAPESCSEDGSHVPSRSSRDLPPGVVDVGHGPSDGPRSAQATFAEDGTHLPWCPSCNLPTPGMDASNRLSNGPYSAPTSYPSNFLSSHTSMHDALAAASSSSAVSGWRGDTTVLSSPSKKTVSSPKLRIATGKRRKNQARFICSMCGDTFTAKHNLNNHLNSHRGVKPHLCEGCPSTFGNGSSLKRHRKTCKQTKFP